MQQVPNIETTGEKIEGLAMWFALIAAIASMALSGGATTPAVAIILGIIAVANFALATFLAARHISKRKEDDTLELDADVALEIINVIAAAVGLSAMGRMAQLGSVAKTAVAAGNIARAVSTIAKIEQIGKMMLAFDLGVMGSTAVIVSYKVHKDIAKINSLDIPQSQKDILLRQVAADALLQGAMLAFQTVMMARAHMEMAKQKLENSPYRSLEERQWIDETGKVTNSAPPSLRRAFSTGELNGPAQRPSFNVEEEAGLVFDKVKEQGSALRTESDPEYDAIIDIENGKGEKHSYRRRREEGIWCRHSNDAFCITDKDLGKWFNNIDNFLGLTKNEGGGDKQPKTSWPTMTEDIEAAVQQGVKDVKAEVGKQWLPPWLYGTKLHKKVADIIRKMKLPKGWNAVVEKPLREWVKSGKLDPSIANMKVNKYLKNSLLGSTLKDSLPENMMNKTIGDLIPDLILEAPDGKLVVWDLTSRSTEEHLAKTMFLMNVLRGEKGMAIPGETNYKWTTHIELDSTEQARFTTPKDKMPLVTVKNDKILPLIRRSAGTGTQQGKLPPGISGSTELITGKDVIGKYYDPKLKAMVDTRSFVIHYSNDGLYIEPVKP